MDWSVLPGGSLNDTPIFLFPLSEVDPKQLDVNCWISFHRGRAATAGLVREKWLKCAHYAH
jgi:hypothetical protein